MPKIENKVTELTVQELETAIRVIKAFKHIEWANDDMNYDYVVIAIGRAIKHIDYVNDMIQQENENDELE